MNHKPSLIYEPLLERGNFNNDKFSLMLLLYPNLITTYGYIAKNINMNQWKQNGIKINALTQCITSTLYVAGALCRVETPRNFVRKLFLHASTDLEDPTEVWASSRVGLCLFIAPAHCLSHMVMWILIGYSKAAGLWHEDYSKVSSHQLCRLTLIT